MSTTYKTFEDLRFEPMISHGGKGARCTFPNGYTVSVVRHRYSYGGDAGLYELAVIRKGRIVYDTPVTDDVLGHLTEDAVTSIMKEVQELPEGQS